MKTICWLALGLVGVSGVASAQYVIGDMQYVCPAGVPWNDPRCIRQPIESDSNLSRPELLRPLGQWKTTWGAIALAESTGDVGVVVGKYLESEAQHEAMNRCAEHGAKDCKLQFAYENQCAVIAWASEDGQLVGGAAVVRGGPSIEDATQGALASCSSRRNGGECKIVYSDCTKPVFEKF